MQAASTNSRALRRLTESYSTKKGTLPCTSVLSPHCSLVYSLLGKDIQCIFMSVIHLDTINLLFSVMSYTCFCPDGQVQRYRLSGPTLACCSQQASTGAVYHSDSIEVCLVWRRQLEIVSDMVTMNSVLVWLMINNLWVVAQVNRVKEAMPCRGAVSSSYKNNRITTRVCP